MRLILAWAIALIALTAAAQTTVILPNYGLTPKPPDSPLPTIMAHVLDERTTGLADLRVMSANRGHALVTAASRGRGPMENLQAEISTRVPVDAVVILRANDEHLIMRVHQQSGVTVHNYPLDSRDLQALAATIGGDLATDLALSPASRAVLTATPEKDARIFDIYHRSQVLAGGYMIHTGETRLELLQPLAREFSTNVMIARRVLEEATSLASWARVGEDELRPARIQGQVALPVVLASPDFGDLAAAADFIRLYPEFAKDVVAIAGKSLAGEISMDALEDDGDLLGDGGKSQEDPLAGQRRLGALYVLAATGSPALPKLQKTLLDNDNEKALLYIAHGECQNPEQTVERLQALVRHPNADVAIAAGIHLPAEARGDVTELRAKARKSTSLAAAMLLTDIGETADLQALTSQTNQQVSRRAWRALLQQDAVSEEAYLALLSDVDPALVVQAARRPPAARTDAMRDRLIVLANEPFPQVSEAARDALTAWRPTDPMARAEFDLAAEHPYLRSRILATFAAAPDAVARLTAACSNLDPFTRAEALQLLHQADPSAARPVRLKMLGDSELWVRLQAAALLEAADKAEPAVTALAKTARDPVVRYHLDRVLTGATAPLPPARLVAGKQHAWSFGMGADAANSPITAYYMGEIGVDDVWRSAYDAGKTVLARTSPLNNPGLIITDPRSRDAFWLSLMQQVKPEDLAYIDGLIYGEESMGMDGSALWSSGWRLFCIDAGIDPATVNGDLDALTPPQKGAWQHWAAEREVDGFNALYHFTHNYLGALKPGFQVATYLPKELLTQGGANPASRRWLFDVVGNYDYKGCNRIAAYMVTRQMKTLWPDRPVIWFSFGEGGYEMNPVRHNSKLPQTPIANRSLRGYADTISAWSAGAQPGWFSVWIAVDPEFSGGMGDLRGVMLRSEDMADRALLGKAAAFSTRGLVETMASMAKPATDPGASASMNDDDVADLVLDEPEDPLADYKKQVAEKEAGLVRGFQVYGRYLYDLAALARDLPPVTPTPTALVVEPRLSVWYRGTAWADVPGADLLAECDVLQDLNTLPELDADRYRYIAVHDPRRLQDATIERLARWLREQPGLLYIHGDLTADNSREAATAADHDGVLQRNWPWESDLQITPLEKSVAVKSVTVGGADQALAHALRLSDVTTSGDRSTVLATADGKPVLVLWRHPDFRGAVLVDTLEQTDGAWLDILRTQIRELAANAKLEVTLPDQALHQDATVDGVSAIAASPYSGKARTPVPAPPGLDWFAGVPVEALSTRREAVVASTAFTGKHVVILGDIAVLSQAELTTATVADGAVTLQASGVIRLMSSRELTVSPTLTSRELDWLFAETSPGVVHLPPEKGRDAHLYYLRADGPITVR